MERDHTRLKTVGTAAVVATTTKSSAVKRNPAGGGGPKRETSDNLLAKLDDTDKKGKKYFRILAVFLYLLSVSLGAIILGIYYSIFWEHSSLTIAGGGSGNTLVATTLIEDDFNITNVTVVAI